MGRITLKRVFIRDTRLQFEYSVSSELEEYFSDCVFFIEYDENIEEVPLAVLTIPFVCNVLPVAWLTDSMIEVDELDKSFYECIPNVRKGYETMFPDCSFLGSVHPRRIVECSVSDSNKTAMLFSGGLDSVQTLISHVNESPHLISIWGADFDVDNYEGWNVAYTSMTKAVEQLSLKKTVIRSSFRKFDREDELDKRFSKQLGDGWWHGVKHGLALLGHVAPYVWLNGISTLYIASSNWESLGLRKCASSPLTDNYVRFTGCKVVHDGFEYNRQDKVHNLVQYSKSSGKEIPIHVCWETQAGDNCCKCEKCYRTMWAIFAEGVSPMKYGFSYDDSVYEGLRPFLVNYRNHPYIKLYWFDIQKAVRDNIESIRNQPCYKPLKWVMSLKFDKPETIKMPLNHRIRAYLSRFGFYQKLHKLKSKSKI